MSDSSESLSALEANIKEKGSNAYYFAHGLKIKGPQWDGKEEPRLLSVDETIALNNKNRKIVESFESYAWADCGKHIKIYIDYNEADNLDIDKVFIVSCTLLHYNIHIY